MVNSAAEGTGTVQIDIDTSVLGTSLHSEKAVANLLEFAMQLQEARGYRYLSQAWQEIAEAGASRVGQLYRYKVKRRDSAAKFRPYKPLKLSATERGNVERAARAEGIATERDDRAGQCETVDNGRRCLLARGHELESGYPSRLAHKF